VNLKDFWQNRRNSVSIFVVIGIIIAYTLWYIYINPQHITLFLTTTIVALGFVAVMALLPEYRQKLVKWLLAYEARKKETGRQLYRFRRIALVLFFIVILTFPLLLQFQFIPTQYMPWAILSFFIAILALGAIQIVGLLTVAGRWGLLLIAIITAIVILRIFIWS